MNRATFIKSVFLSGIFFSAQHLQAATSNNKKRKIKLLECPVAGYQYYDGHLIENQLSEGTPLRLKAEPDNPYDENAIAVYYKNYKLGYVPKKDNKVISNMMGERIELPIKITEVNRNDGNLERIKILISLCIKD